ncbi:MAG TPA: DUF1501 domain-containing protein [Gemmataceae bacterium]|jgi:uncharacterized protein (DUF1501 family)
MISRRTFLQSSALVSLVPTVPSFLAQTARAASPQQDSRVLVVIQLDGGNDGINTVVPFQDEGYAKYRKSLRLAPGDLIKINDRVGLHPALRATRRLLDSGRLAIVQGVGYPNPNRSHFESMAIWHTARLKPAKDNSGWLGHALDGAHAPADGSPDSALIGLGSPPQALRGERSLCAALAHLDDLVLSGAIDPRRAILPWPTAGDVKAFVSRSMLDAYTTAARLKDAASAKDAGVAYPATGLSDRLRLIARLLKAGFGTRVYYTVQAGYDTHYSQSPQHANLLDELGGALYAFLEDLKSAKLDERVLVLVFSEFGRRVAENGSLGTDHGTAGPVLLAGPRVKPGLVGETPSLLDLQEGDLKMGLDFRQVYATILDRWLGCSGAHVLGDHFELLPVL